MKIKIEDPTVHERSGQRGDGSKWSALHQQGLAQVGPEVRLIKIPCRSHSDALRVGTYTMEPAFTVSQYGDLQLNMREARFVAVQKAA